MGVEMDPRRRRILIDVEKVKSDVEYDGAH